MRRAPIIELTDHEQQVLNRTVRSPRSAVRDVFRARIILLAAQDHSSLHIANQLNTGQDTVSKWRRRFAQLRLDGLFDQPGRGRKRQYTEPLIERIVEDTLHTTPEQATHWSTRTMAEHAGVSHTTVQRIWHAHELKPHLLRTFKLSNDKYFVEKLRDVIGLYLNPLSMPLVFCVDEKSQIQALDRSQPGLPMKKGRAGTFTHDYKRHRTTTLFAALNVFEGTVMGKCYPRHRHTEYLRFLREIDRVTPRRSRRASHRRQLLSPQTRTGEEVVGPSSTFPRAFHPTSSSWLNLVERFFREITDKRIRRGIFHSVRELTKAIYDYLEHYTSMRSPLCGPRLQSKSSTNSLLSTQRVDNWT